MASAQRELPGARRLRHRAVRSAMPISPHGEAGPYETQRLSAVDGDWETGEQGRGGTPIYARGSARARSGPPLGCLRCRRGAKRDISWPALFATDRAALHAAPPQRYRRGP
jgi:hypothetical protein